MLVGHAEALLERAALAEAELAAAAGTVAGRGRIAAFESVALQIALPAIEALGREAPQLRCELVEAEPERSLPALALGDLDLVLADEWQLHPLGLPDGVVRHELPGDPVRIVLPADHPVAARHPEAVPLAELAARAVGQRRRRHGLGGDDPPHLPRAGRLRPRRPPPRGGRDRRAGARRARARRGDAAGAAARGARRRRARWSDRAARDGAPRSRCARSPRAPCDRAIFAATRAADAARPSTRALLAAVQAAAGA